MQPTNYSQPSPSYRNPDTAVRNTASPYVPSDRSSGELYEQWISPAPESGKRNVGAVERSFSIASGLALAVSGMSRGSLPGLLTAGLGGAMLHRGVSGNCKVYKMLGINKNAN